MNNININKFLTSGLNGGLFYTLYNKDEIEMNAKVIDKDKVFAWQEENKKEIKNKDELIKDLMNKITSCNYYVTTKLPSFDLSMHCGLIPFISMNKEKCCYCNSDNSKTLHLLAPYGDYYESNFKLEYYQVKRSRTIDPNSYYITERKHFKEVMGEEITEDMDRLLTTKQITINI